MYTWMPLSSRADLAHLAKHISREYAPNQVAKRLIRGMSSAVKGVLIEAKLRRQGLPKHVLQLLREEGTALPGRLRATALF